MSWAFHILQRAPEVALFLSLALGYAVGKIRFGKFQLGGVAGSLLAAIVVSQSGAHIDDSVKDIMFALFIYAVGYQSGPQFFSSLNRSALKEVAMSIFLAVAALATALLGAKLLDLDKGLAAGVTAGALNASAMVGTASEAIGRAGLSPEQAKALQANVAIAFGATYVLGVLAGIVMSAQLVPRFMRSDLKSDAKKAEKLLLGGTPGLGPGQAPALTPFVSRAYRVQGAAGRSVQEIETSVQDFITIERIERAGQLRRVEPNAILEAGDVIVVVGRREAMVEIGPALGEETIDPKGDSLIMQSRQAVFTRRGMNHVRVADLRPRLDRELHHGVYLQSISRMGATVPILPQTEVVHGDLVTFYGTPEDTERAARASGYAVAQDNKTDFVYLGLGLVAGLLIGLISVRLAGVSLSVGSGGGALLAGLFFGWMRAKRPMFGAMPSAAAQLLRDFGLAVFVAVLGLNTGRTAIATLKGSGVAIVLLGIIMAVVPSLLTMLFGRYLLRYNNSAILAGALAGSRCSTPAFEEVLQKSESSVPTVPFAVTYALANVLLTLLGPLIVDLV